MLTLVPQTDPILHQNAQAVAIFDDQMRQIAKEMLALTKEHHGVGLAAPQVGIGQQIIVISPGRNPLVLINPQILTQSAETAEGEEGCLSLPDAGRLNIARAQKVSVAYQDEFGRPQTIKAKGLTARVLQHEIDHLNGILITDRAKKDE